MKEKATNKPVTTDDNEETQEPSGNFDIISKPKCKHWAGNHEACILSFTQKKASAQNADFNKGGMKTPAILEALGNNFIRWPRRLGLWPSSGTETIRFYGFCSTEMY